MNTRTMKNPVQPHIQWITEHEGRGDEFGDLTVQARTMATLALQSSICKNGTSTWEELHI